MYRFQTSPQRTPGKKLWVSLLLFLFLILLFTLGTSSLREYGPQTKRKSHPGPEPGYHLLLCNNRSLSGKPGSYQKRLRVDL